MPHNIEAVFLDLGNTLRILLKDEVHQSQARLKITELVGTDEDPVTFCAKLDERYKVYRKWAFENLKEAPDMLSHHFQWSQRRFFFYQCAHSGAASFGGERLSHILFWL